MNVFHIMNYTGHLHLINWLTNLSRKCPHALLDLAFKKPVSASAQPWEANYTPLPQLSKQFFNLFCQEVNLSCFALTYTLRLLVLRKLSKAYTIYKKTRCHV